MSFDGQQFGRQIVAVVKDYVEAATAPLLKRIAELEQRPAPVSIVEAIKGADGVLRLTLSDGRMLDTGIRDGAPGQDAFTPDFTAMVAAAVDPVRGELSAYIDKRVAQIPVPRDGQDAKPEEVAAALRDVLMPDVTGMIAERVAAIEVPVAVVDPEMIQAAVQLAVSAIPPAAPGKNADPEEIRLMVDEAVSRIPVPKDGVTPSPEEVRSVVEAVVAEMPKPKDGEPGKDADMDEVRALIEASVARRVAEIPVPKDGKPGKDGRLPVVKAWEDRVYYAGEVCAFDGSTWQASVDTGRAPPHTDWTCLAARGEKGRDADQIVPRGAFNEAEDYPRLSIVMLGGASFIANRDNPGPCPGEGWNLLAKQGKKGDPGEARKGDPGIGIARILFDESQGLLTIHKDDGSSDEIDLYPILSRIG